MRFSSGTRLEMSFKFLFDTIMQGGYVEINRGAWRIHGILSVSRSIGDAHLKAWVSAEPDTKILHLTPDMQFLVLASDGLWEKVRKKRLNICVVTRKF